MSEQNIYDLDDFRAKKDTTSFSNGNEIYFQKANSDLDSYQLAHARRIADEAINGRIRSETEHLPEHYRKQIAQASAFLCALRIETAAKAIDFPSDVTQRAA